VKYLLDTHVLLWIAKDDPRLSQTAKSLYLDDGNEMFCSLASLWELAIKISMGKLSLDQPLQSFIDEHIFGNNIKILFIQTKHILPLENLPFHHKDPFDRLIIAQAIVESIPVISTTFGSIPIQFKESGNL